MKYTIRIGLSVILFAMISQPAWAARTKWHDLAESTVYKEKMGGMIGRGLLNVITSPVDVLVGTVDGTKAGPPLVGTLTGIGKGVGCGVLRLGSGAVDIVTFWVPGFNGFSVATDYGACMNDRVSSAAIIEEPVFAPITEPTEISLESELFLEPAAETIAQTPERTSVGPIKPVWKK